MEAGRAVSGAAARGLWEQVQEGGHTSPFCLRPGSPGQTSDRAGKCITPQSSLLCSVGAPWPWEAQRRHSVETGGVAAPTVLEKLLP